jgi:propanol-preferring alcohol dehydrogenase
MSTMNKRVEVTGKFPAPLAVVERPLPQCPPKGVIVKTHFAGICHTDVHCWHDAFKLEEGKAVTMADYCGPDFSWPIVMGHEISGVVYQLGSEYQGQVKVGDRVVLYPWIGCNDCGFCRVQKYATCEKVLGLCNGMGGRDGGYQQYVVGPNADFAVKVPDSIGLDVACMFGCSTLTSFTAVQTIQSTVETFCKMNGRASVLIVGAGGLGLWAVTLAKAILPAEAKVFVADIAEEKFGPALALGADGTVLWDRESSEDELIARTKAATGGVDASMDFVGLGTTVMRTFKCTNKAAKMALIGLAGGIADIPPVNVIIKVVEIAGALVGQLDQARQLCDMYAAKKVKCIPVTLVAPEQAENSLKLLAGGKITGRHVIDFTK